MAIKTHYAILKVTQDAPDEVISAAYKALALKYHPDRAGDSPEAMAVMQEINISYKILSDPKKRAEHDRWIAQQRQQQREQSTGAASGAAQKPDAGKTAAKQNSGGGKSMEEANKWKAWADKTAQEAKEAQERADKARADLAKAVAADRAKWEAWVEKTTKEAQDAKERAEKAAEQSAKYVEAAVKARVHGDGA